MKSFAKLLLAIALCPHFCSFALGQEVVHSRIFNFLSLERPKVREGFVALLAGTWRGPILDASGKEVGEQVLHFVKGSNNSLVCYANLLSMEKGRPKLEAVKYESPRMAKVSMESCRQGVVCIAFGDEAHKLYVRFVDRDTIRAVECLQGPCSGYQAIEGVFSRKVAECRRALALGLDALEGCWCATFNSADQTLSDKAKLYLSYSLHFHKLDDRMAYRGLFKLRAPGLSAFDTTLESAYKGEVLEHLTVDSVGKVIDRSFLIDVATYARFLDEETLEIFFVDWNLGETNRAGIARDLVFKMHLVGSYRRNASMTTPHKLAPLELAKRAD